MGEQDVIVCIKATLIAQITAITRSFQKMDFNTRLGRVPLHATDLRHHHDWHTNDAEVVWRGSFINYVNKQGEGGVSQMSTILHKLM